MVDGRNPRETLARHAPLRSPGPLRQLLRLLGVVATVLLVSTAGIAAYAFTDFSSTFADGSVDFEHSGEAPPDIGALDNEGVSILFSGLDVCEDAYKKRFPGRCDENVIYDTGTRADARNDVNMVMHISPEPRRVTVISFPRDLMIAAPECTTPEGAVTPAVDRIMLNEVYERGDITCVADTLSQLTGLDIDYAASIKWGGVIEVTDAIGGVDVCVGGEGIYDLENTGLALEPGTHNLKGQEALEFLRTRYGVGGSDLNRIGNQQVYMSALVRKLTSEEVLTNPGTLLTLARTVLANVQPTSTLTDPVVLARVALAARDVPLSDYAFVPYPVLDDPTAPNRVVPESYRAAALFEAIRANEPLDLRGPGGGAVLAEEGDDTSPEEEEPPAEEPSEEPEPEEPSADVDFLGSHADQPTCSDGAGQR